MNDFGLNNLKKTVKKSKRIGRGGSRGGTSGRGHKGQGSRSGGGPKKSFEGGQMPLARRLPKRGFNNAFKPGISKNILNLDTLEMFEEGAIVDLKALRERRVFCGSSKMFIKVLGSGTLSKKLEVRADAFSKSAIKAIEACGGTVHIEKGV